MKESIEQMRERHKQEIKQLEDGCEHRDISDWMEYMWAPGHYSGRVKTCNFCGKIVIDERPKPGDFRLSTKKDMTK